MIKAIIFDFDGTLTHQQENTWKKIWKDLGYDTTSEDSAYKTQMRDYLNNTISYQDWCDQTCIYYKKSKFSLQHLKDIAKTVVFIDGFEDFIDTLKKENISLHIVSGNFVELITSALGEKAKYFDSINANTLVFDNEGIISQIIGTKYDYEGKAKFIEEYCSKYNILPSEICFVGNGDNDQWAHLSGCKTICINPDTDTSSNKTMWHICLDKIDNINDLLPYIIDKK